jgi:acetyltransferase-like isoleucine patch superfamily enzyme
MSFLLKLQNCCGRCSTRIYNAWHRNAFMFREKPGHRKIEVGDGVVFYVPVRGGGCGTLTIGSGTKFGFPQAHRLGTGEIMLQARTPDSEIRIGNNNWFNNNTMLCALGSIRIGNDCQIGDLVSIVDADFHETNPATRNRSPGEVKPIVIGNNVWIGSRAMILKGVTIGDNSVVGAMSLVTREVPPNCIVAGVPAKVVRQLE